MPNTPQIAQTGVFDLLAQSGPMAKLVLLILCGSSVLCWAVIIAKYKVLRQATEENAGFLNAFWHGKSLDEIFSRVDQYPQSPVASVFKAGYKEMRKLSQTTDATGASGLEGVDNINRALARSTNAEIAALEKNVTYLATIASAAPFVGLFGTVWGIMNSFQSIGASGAANLAVVAPGISEALITTAAGIGAAIPAVVGYNHFAGQIKRIGADMDNFSQDLLNIVQRSLIGGGRKQPPTMGES